MKYYTVDYCSVGIDEEDYKKLKKVLEGDNPTIEEQDFSIVTGKQISI